VAELPHRPGVLGLTLVKALGQQLGELTREERRARLSLEEHQHHEQPEAGSQHAASDHGPPQQNAQNGPWFFWSGAVDPYKIHHQT